MTHHEPSGELDARYSDERATATSWAEAERHLERAPVSWLTTVRPDGRPHVTPLLTVWHEGALHFCTGADEQKAVNLRTDPRCALTTGTNALDTGLDIVVEGEAERIADDDRLHPLAAAWQAKYGTDWHFDVRHGMYHHEAGAALVFAVAPITAYGFAKDPYGQTRWRFAHEGTVAERAT